MNIFTFAYRLTYCITSVQFPAEILSSCVSRRRLIQEDAKVFSENVHADPILPGIQGKACLEMVSFMHRFPFALRAR